VKVRGMVEDKLEEISNVLLEVIENQKIIEKELKYLRDDLKAQNRLISEMLKIHKLHQQTSNKQTRMLERMSKKLD
jgi:hypothetical protein